MTSGSYREILVMTSGSYGQGAMMLGSYEESVMTSGS